MEAVLEGYHVDCVGITDRVVERVFALTRDEVPTEPAIRALCGLPPAES